MTRAFEDPDLPLLVAAAMELRDGGVEPPYEEICRARPDLVEQVRQSVEFAARLPDIARPDQSVLGGRYRLDARIGAGAMGVVYRGTDKELGRPVAIKILRAAMLDAEEADARFLREAEVMAAIRHPAVATLHDRGRTPEGDTYLVMELLEGVPLADLLDEAERRGAAVHGEHTDWIAAALGGGDLPEPTFLRTAVRWIAELAAGLHAAHEAGVVHRDIKPSNIFVRQDGRPVLLDFGIASRQNHATITRAGGALGTPAYMAPESLDDRRLPQRQTDVYGLGATLYHLLTLRAPFRGTPSQILAKLQQREPTPARRLRPTLPRDLQAILDKALARRPATRYATAADLGADLLAFLEHRPVAARPVWAATRLLRRVRRSPAFWTGATVTAVAVAIAVGTDWHTASRAAAEDTWWRVAWCHLPANATLGSFPNRTVVDPEERAETARVLDLATELAPNPLPARAYRAAFRLDHGDVAGCIADMRQLARELGTDYAADVASRFAALPSTANGAPAVDLAGLPAPASADDVLLAAYLSYRALDREVAERLLGDPRLADSLPAEDLRLLLLANRVERTKDSAERSRAAGVLYERCVRRNARPGRESAGTAHATSFALLMLGRYRDCFQVASAGIALAPWSFTLRVNAARAARRLGRPRTALRLLCEARDLRPGFAKPRRELFYTLIDLGELDEAAAVLDAMPPTDGSTLEEFHLATMHGILAGERALVLHQAGDRDAMQAAAELANEYFATARTYEPRRPQPYAVVTAGLATGEDRHVFAGLTVATANGPLTSARIRRMLAWMPSELAGNDLGALRFFLDSLAATALGAEENPVPLPGSSPATLPPAASSSDAQTTRQPK
ncbi:MAG: serine/threonine protein kinase [Planctomycetes bacterium]|nr:serine/threonine protein kinase [Planctomycetota bacterium]